MKLMPYFPHVFYKLLYRFDSGIIVESNSLNFARMFYLDPLTALVSNIGIADDYIIK